MATHSHLEPAAPAGTQPAMPRSPRRRGLTSLMAMLYLVVFASLALGFYAQTNMSSQIAGNDLKASHAIAAAQSGMAFMRYQLSNVELQYLPDDQLLVELAYELQRLMADTGNLVNGASGYQEVGMSDTGDAILIPSDPNAVIELGNGGGFRCKITRSGRRFVVKVVGKAAGATSGTGKGVEYTFSSRQLRTPLFDYGVAGRGQIEVGGGGQIRGGTDPAYGSVLTVTTLNPAVAMTGPGVISGKVYYTNPAATYSYSNNSSVNGSTDATHKANSTLHQAPPADWDPNLPWPEFPTIDTNIYKSYATNLCLSPVGTYFKNIRIPAGLGTVAAPFTFGSGTTIEGVCYIEAPNVVWFAGGCTVRGVVVGPNAPTGTLLDNIVEFRGQATAYDMSTLPDTADFPAELRALKGMSVCMPKFHVKFTGGYASVSGSIVSDQLTFSGGAGGNITGYVIGMANQRLVVSGQGVVQIEKPPPTPWPAGMFFRHYYAPNPKTYREFHPSTESM